MLNIELHIVQIAVAASYITLGVFSPESARQWWWLYAIITILLSAANLYRDWRPDEH